MKNFSAKTWASTENNLKIPDKKQTFLASPKQPYETHGHQMLQLMTDLATRKKPTAEKLKKAFRLKLWEI